MDRKASFSMRCGHPPLSVSLCQAAHWFLSQCLSCDIRCFQACVVHVVIDLMSVRTNWSNVSYQSSHRDSFQRGEYVWTLSIMLHFVIYIPQSASECFLLLFLIVL